MSSGGIHGADDSRLIVAGGSLSSPFDRIADTSVEDAEALSIWAKASRMLSIHFTPHS